MGSKVFKKMRPWWQLQKMYAMMLIIFGTGHKEIPITPSVA